MLSPVGGSKKKNHTREKWYSIANYDGNDAVWLAVSLEVSWRFAQIGGLMPTVTNAEVNRPQLAYGANVLYPILLTWSLVSALMSFAQEY